MKRVFLRHEYRNKVIKLHNLIERLVTNRPILKVSLIEAKEEQECIHISKCVYHVICGGHGQWVTIRRSVHQLLFTEIIDVFETEPVTDSWGEISHGFSFSCSGPVLRRVPPVCEKLGQSTQNRVSHEEDIWGTSGHHVHWLEETLWRTRGSLWTTTVWVS